MISRILMSCMIVTGGVAMSARHAIAAWKFGDSIGVNVKFSQGEKPSDLQFLKELGVHWVRDTVDWPTMEPVAGKYEVFPRAFQDRLSFYKENDIGIVFGLWYDNTKAYPNSDNNPSNSIGAEAYGNYAVHIAKLLKQSGVRFVIELYNEPHTSLKWLLGSWNGKPPAPWLDRYVEIVSSAVGKVKAFDPTIHLLANDDMWVIQYWFLEKGLPKELDGLSVHPYVKSWPEFSAVMQETDWAKPFVLVDADRSFTSSVRRLREQAAKKLGHTPAIWATEWGWPLGDAVDYIPMTDDLLAGLIPRAFITSAASGVEVLCWFSLQDSVDGPMGLTDNQGNRRASFQAFKQMSTEIGSATAFHQILGEDRPTSGVQVYRFDLPTGSKLVAWNIDGAITAKISHAPNLRVRDAAGHEVQLSIDATHDTTITLGRSPLYIDAANDTVLTPNRAPISVPPEYLFR